MASSEKAAATGPVRKKLIIRFRRRDTESLAFQGLGDNAARIDESLLQDSRVNIKKIYLSCLCREALPRGHERNKRAFTDSGRVVGS